MTKLVNTIKDILPGVHTVIIIHYDGSMKSTDDSSVLIDELIQMEDKDFITLLFSNSEEDWFNVTYERNKNTGVLSVQMPHGRPILGHIYQEELTSLLNLYLMPVTQVDSSYYGEEDHD
jgi:hypothetical protein